MSIYYKYLKYKNKYLNLVGGAAAVEIDNGEKLSNIAKNWIDKGTYVTGDEYFYVDLVYGTVINYFMVLFADWKNIFSKNLIGIKEIAEKKYEDRTLSFNCWQFVLLCMMECGLITKENIKNFYSVVMNSTEKRVPLYFMNDDTELFEYDDKINLGDIILVKNSENVIYHVGIYIGNNKFTQIFFYFVSEIPINNFEKKIYYIKYETVARNIIEIKNRKDIKYKEYKFPDIKMIRIPIVKYYQKDIDKILNKMFELSDYSQIKDDNEKIAYLKKDPVLFEELGFGAPIDRLVKQNFFNFNRSEIEDKILELNNIIFQD